MAISLDLAKRPEIIWPKNHSLSFPLPSSHLVRGLLEPIAPTKVPGFGCQVSGFRKRRNTG